VEAISADFSYFCHETVSSPGHRFYVPSARFTILKRLAQKGNMLREIGFFDKGVWPHLLQEFIFFEQVPAVCHQHRQSVKSFWRKAHRNVVA
jgi:hypothetical protein